MTREVGAEVVHLERIRLTINSIRVMRSHLMPRKAPRSPTS